MKTAARLIGGLVNMHTTVESEFLEVKSTPFCLMCNTKGKSENPWTIRQIGDAIELVINELHNDEIEKHDWRIAYVGTSGECYGISVLLEELLGINGDAKMISEDRIDVVAAIACDAINARLTLFDKYIDDWNDMHCLMFNSNSDVSEIESESDEPWKVVSLGEAVQDNILNLCGFPFDHKGGNWHVVYVGTRAECENAEDIFVNSLGTGVHIAPDVEDADPDEN